MSHCIQIPSNASSAESENTIRPERAVSRFVLMNTTRSDGFSFLINDLDGSPVRRVVLLGVRTMAVLAAGTILYAAHAARAAPASSAPATITYPEVSEAACPVEAITIVGKDGNKVSAFVRTPPGRGPFPAIIILHGGLVPHPLENIRQDALKRPSHTRFLAAGYVTVTPTFRARHENPQSRDPLEDCIAVVAHVKKMPAVDPRSVVVFGGSGGGSLGLELAGETDLSAVIAGEPASVLFTGMMKPGMGERGRAFQDVMNNPRKYYTPELQTFTRAKVAQIHCPVLFVLGDKHPIVKVNHEVLIPEMKAANKPHEVIVYPGQPHSFYWGIIGNPAAGRKFFDDAQAFLKKYLPTQPRPIDESLIKRLPVPDRDSAQEAEDRPRKGKRTK